MDLKMEGPIIEESNNSSTLEMFSHVCRICLQSGELSSLYYKPESSELSFSEKIMQVTSINLEKKDRSNDKLPENICSSCIQDLEASYRFKMNCESSDAILQTYIVTSNESGECSEVSDEEEDELADRNDSETEYPESDLYHYAEVADTADDDIRREENIVIIEKPMTNKQAEISASKPKKESVKDRVARAKRSAEKNNQDQQKLHICEICANTYKFRHALEIHMRRHKGDRPFKCEHCERSFVIRFELKRHMRTHNGLKPYGCRYCERKFSDFGSRIKHERSHTGERPYICSTCGKTFAYSHVLSGHMLTHTGEKKFVCQQCGKRFTKSHHLKSHLNTHLKAMNKANVLSSQTNNQPPPASNRMPEQIKNEPSIHIQTDEDLLHVVQLGFQVINPDKY